MLRKTGIQLLLAGAVVLAIISFTASAQNPNRAPLAGAVVPAAVVAADPAEVPTTISATRTRRWFPVSSGMYTIRRVRILR